MLVALSGTTKFTNGQGWTLQLQDHRVLEAMLKRGGFPSTEKPVNMAKVECEGPDPTQLAYIQSPERGVGQYLAVNCPSQSPELSIPRI